MMTPRKESRSGAEGVVGRDTAGSRGDRLSNAIRTLTWALSTAIIIALCLGAITGRGWLMRQVAVAQARDPGVRFDWPTLAGGRAAAERVVTVANAAAEPQTWLDPVTRQRLSRLALSELSTDPMDGESLARAQRALMRTGWFAAPVQLTRLSDGTVRIRGEWRLPEAVVRSEGADRLVASDGCQLDLTYRPEHSGLPVILNVPTPPPGLGKLWIGGEVEAGLALIRTLKGSPCWPQVYGVDTRDFAAHHRLVILTTDQGRVVWGGRPGEFNPGQASDATKLARLSMLKQSTGRIDAGQDEIDISLISGF